MQTASCVNICHNIKPFGQIHIKLTVSGEGRNGRRWWSSPPNPPNPNPNPKIVGWWTSPPEPERSTNGPLRTTTGPTYLRINTPVQSDPTACLYSGDSRWVGGTSSCWRNVHGRGRHRGNRLPQRRPRRHQSACRWRPFWSKWDAQQPTGATSAHKTPRSGD